MKGVFKIVALLMAIVIAGTLSYILLTFAAVVEGLIKIIKRYRMKRIVKITGLLMVLVIAGMVLYALLTFPAVMSGTVAKTTCSCVYLTGRSLESVRKKELQMFPGLSGAGIELNNQDSTVVASILWKKSKAIFRKGLGCILLAELPEDEVRNQKINLPPPPANQDSLLWPTGNITSDSLQPGVNDALIQKAIDNAFADIDPEDPVHTHAVVVLYKGQIIGEKYAEGFNLHSKLMGWSMTKSITNALVGILVKEGKLNVHDPAPVVEWQHDERKEITLQDLLHASSGLAWNESLYVPTSNLHTLFVKRDDKGGYAASVKLKNKPGDVFQYSSGSANIISRIVRQAVGDEQYYRFPYEKLFYKIGMNHVVLEPDASGTFVGSSYGWGTARDWARFGLLYLNDGVWNGERILPEGWVKYSTTPGPAAKKQQYGALWWLNYGDPKNPGDVQYPGLPKDAFMATGFEKQFVVVVPSKKLVVVRLGVTHNKNFSIADLVNDVIKGLPE
jgi:CubicO group peptidase (beta-lactamase class C family)